VHIKAVREDGPPVRVARFHDAEDEAEGIAKLLWQYAPSAGANPWQSCAVLVRTNVQIAAISKALAAAGIPIGSTAWPRNAPAAIRLPHGPPTP
jgi:superfamily I DNA/RNA helicase